MNDVPTRERIVAAANRLFYREGIRAVSVDAVADEAGITKKSLYYHFRSKDELIAAYLSHRDQPNLAAYRRWFDRAEGDVGDRVCAIFDHLAKAAARADWKGCGFLRTSAELANLPGHPALRIGRAHKKAFESWLAQKIAEAGISGAGDLARQVMLLLDGCFSVAMLHRDATYMGTAGAAAKALIHHAQTQAGATVSP
jgi:AcrR family transcriptional regulator